MVKMTVLTGGEKSLYKMTKQEKETTILFNEAEATAEIETYSVKMRNRLNGLSLDYPMKVEKLSEDSDGCVRYRVAKALITIRQPYGEERRQADRLRAVASRYGSVSTDK